MGHIPFTEADIKVYGAWLSPSGDFELVPSYAGHVSAAIKIGLAFGLLDETEFADVKNRTADDIWDLTGTSKGVDTQILIDKAYDAVFGKGYCRILFNRGKAIDFEFDETNNVSLVAESMTSLPNAKLSTSLRKNRSAYKDFNNLADFKVKMGLRATVNENLRSGVEPIWLTTKPQEEQEANFSLAWVRKFCKFARTK